MALATHMPATRVAVSSVSSDTARHPSRQPHHSKYYIQDSLITFVVENQLFRVHRHFFEWESEFFKALFTLPGDSCREGTSDDSPISLPGVSIPEFEALLDYFYFRQSIAHSTLPRNHWTNLLSIASRYDFDDIRERCIKEIAGFRPPLDPVQMVGLALHHDVPEWLEPAYCSLCQRPQPMNESEVNKVGVNIAMNITRARDLLRKRHAPAKLAPIHRFGSQDKCGNAWESNAFADAQVRKVVRDTFWPFGQQ